MTNFTASDLALMMLSASLGINIAFWSVMGALRFAGTLVPGRPKRGVPALSVADVAVVIPAHNEEIGLPKCLRALTAIVPPKQIFVASDGSRDATVAIARAAGCRALDIQPNGGKAKALARAIRHYRLCDRFKAVLIQDADSEMDPHYLEHALPLFDDPEVVAVAGHVLSRWRPHVWPRADMVYAAYRTRLYRLLQMTFQYGQSWRWANVSYIAPGFASMYRTRALREIDITAPGLVIEDFNMTFEVQRKRLGRIAYTPMARCSSEDPFTLKDYRKQVQRWYLGFWQTVRRHGIWPSRFWIALGMLLFELILISLFVLALPFLALGALLAGGLQVPALSLFDPGLHSVSVLDLIVLFLAVDYAITVIAAVIDRRPALLLYGVLFPLIRLLDAALFLRALGQSFTAQSDGRWASPERFATPALALSKRNFHAEVTT
ncbi:glycosyltransferase family 2 protein [Chelativorans salis]|uniref:Glycosyltransferase family 2 protein n=1 Tax=Chelativorans salis TaxID=2978478 RepID=A0ABT2LLK3_9HYPH|nr:glycosyltransferase family 2 protein [Chelativorans sp. EGI FJ00035]MCT7374059.1 glycosyltransferase family 2 protein [Chelativorans sp. EGI FJ00035]